MTPPRYAAQTDVAPEKSRAEIERTLSRYSASAFMYGWSDTEATVQFRMGEKFGYRGIVNFDQGFMPFLVLPGGETVGEWLTPQIENAYAGGGMPSEIRLALPAPS